MKRSLLTSSAIAAGLLVSLSGCGGMFGDDDDQVAARASTEATAGAQASDPAIRSLQEALARSGYSPGEADGIWGPSTEQALRDFQTARGLEATGRVDTQTMAALGMSDSTVAQSQMGAQGSGSAGMSGSGTVGQGGFGNQGTGVDMGGSTMAQAGSDMRNQMGGTGMSMDSMMQDRQAVRELQLALREAGHNPGPIDGVWGPRTQQALQQFQMAQGLQASGRIDVATLNQLGLDHLSRGMGMAGQSLGEQLGTPQPGQGVGTGPATAGGIGGTTGTTGTTGTGVGAGTTGQPTVNR